MAWCETNGVDYLFGLAQNKRLGTLIQAELAQAQAQSRKTGKPARCFKNFTYRTRTTWRRERRVVGKAEFTRRRGQSALRRHLPKRGGQKPASAL